MKNTTLTRAKCLYIFAHVSKEDNVRAQQKNCRGNERIY